MLVDDHRVLAEMLSAAITADGDLEVVGVAATGAEALALARSTTPDVVVLDYDLPDTDGVRTAAALKAAHPDIRVLMLTSYTDAAVLDRALAAGCDGFVTKRHGAADILAALRAVATDQMPISPDMVGAIVRRGKGSYRGLGSDLTERELEVLRLAADGIGNQAIAEQLFLSLNTVRNHMQHVLNKLDAHSKLEAAAIAAKIGLLRR